MQHRRPSILLALFLAHLSTGLLATTLVACDSAPETSAAAPAQQGSGSGERIEGAEARRLVAEENAFILDVRTPGEFAGGHIEGATNIPVSDLSSRLSDVPTDRPVVVYCQSGGRSATAAGSLASAGRTVYDLGPMSAW